ncbi:hypothetical protein [Paenibacillus polymyxa]|uniref:hypothetical protein n=1 Tax=Paenibacillus polymyxa TaxID=1406 RepID=UPI00058A1C5C|nr:hypothetical protein [Paenibacillus polymyxa]AJE52695.1 hypothetical protein RE92_17385 [Paenibacillus polymyxa]QOH63473.1 hypothetical protein DI243_19620 [Paenibacillus polymyxa]
MEHRDAIYQTIDGIFKELNKEFHNFTKANLTNVISKFRKEKRITKQKTGEKNEFTEQDLLVISDYFRKMNYHLDPNYIKENYFTFKEAAKFLKNTPYTKDIILSLADERDSLGVIMYKSVLRVPKKLVFELQENGDVSNYIRAGELARQLKIHDYLVTRRIQNGFFKDTKKIGGRLFVSIKEAEKWSNEITEPIEKYTNDYALLEIRNYLNNLSKRIPIHSHTLFDTWIISKISNSHGRATTIKHIVIFGIELYEFLLEYLPQNVEIYDLDHKIVEAVVSLDTNKRLKKEFVLFYNYSLTYSLASPDKQLRIERPSRNKKLNYNRSQTKRIYHPAIYQRYYSYVQELQIHTKKGLETRSYANMWLFVIMHLTNIWRANDIIFQMPRISIENVGISDFNWFENNKISTSQAQTIANEVYLHFHNKLANKNLNILRFYLDPTLLLGFATAIVICELHSRFPPKSLYKHRDELLGTFISGKKNEYIFSSGLSVHKKFFGNHDDLKNFSSLVMNRSTMVYFFHNTVEGHSSDTDVALELTKMVRSHSENNTTAIYVESSNQDGAINRVSMNLFCRGHFGWLFNYMINLVMSPNFQSLEERTAQIINLKNEFSPLQIEGWSEYFINKKSNKSSAIIQLSRLSEEKLINLLCNIFKGKMPSKHKEGQCLTYPNCETPHHKTCFGCNFFIPQEFILLEAIDELKNRVPILHSATMEAVIIRESKIINSILLLLSEAARFLGNEKLNSFISRKELNEMMYTISNKLLLTEG